MRKLRMEACEQRIALYNDSGFDLSTLDPTISIVPDGAPYLDEDAVEVQSFVESHLSGCDDPMRQIARAAQDWVNHSTLNVEFVADAGMDVPDRYLVLDEGNHGTVSVTHYPAPYIAFGRFPSTPNGKGSDINLAASMCNSPDKLYWVMRHELGHSWGLGHVSGQAVMNGSPSVTSQFDSLQPDDIAGIQAKYGARQHDSWDSDVRNDTWATPDFLFDSIEGADLTTTDDVDNYVIQAQSTTTTITVDPTSLLSPFVLIYSGQPWPIAADSGDYAESASVTFASTPGNYYGVQVLSNDADFQIGRYDLQVEHGGGGASLPTAAARAVAIDYAIEDSTWDLQRLRNSSAPSMRS